ncbi:DUF4145 domain-containing protein [Legionella pneumophila]|uniref:DUF4145 domain-containing protein n=1 Tax=Legionella pneumophila TaxID=446 RepID=UPI001020B929|nr:DUF4145 domain-containing protein [Legionella pneumophila]RYW83733.1 DUF4145 domain-containing protein [Legionella pneumophila]HCD9498753.1 DUF4145 domain-containing protein [Legionella pneumophila]
MEKINRDLWSKPFKEGEFPQWHCSKCKMGISQILPDHFFKFKDADTLAEENKEYFDFDWIKYRFSACLKCNNPKCGEPSIVTGAGEVISIDGDTDNGDYGIDYGELFYPEYCCPPPYVFPIPEQTPNEVKSIILSSFTIFFSDYHSAANKLRVALEYLLIHEGIPKNNKHYKLTTRIKKLCGKHSLDTHDLYDTIRIIGDEGSHGGTISNKLSIEDILDAFDVISFLLSELYMLKNRRDDLNIITKKHKK